MKKRLLLLALTASAAPAFPAFAQSDAADFTTGQRYDADRRPTGTIAPDPDGPAGPLHHQAVRTTYDPAGRPTKVEKGELAAWQSEAVKPKDWTGFTVLQIVDTDYDPLDRKTREVVSGVPSDGGPPVVQSVTEYRHDPAGRFDCTAVRMNPDVWATPLDNACIPGMAHADFGPDRIVRNDYDDAGQLVQTREAVGTPDAAVEATRAYNGNGRLRMLIDAKGNRNEMRYDGFDRLQCWILPAPNGPASYDPSNPTTARDSAGALGGDCVSTGDFERYRYDPNGNRTSLRTRAGELLAYEYDALDRMKLKDRPGSEPDVVYAYDLRGLQLSATFPSTGEAVTQKYDGFGRHSESVTTMGGFTRKLSFQYDSNGNRERMTWPADTAPAGGSPFFVTYELDGMDRVTAIREGGSGALIASYAYDRLGRRKTLTRGNGTSSSYVYDGAGRIEKLGFAFPADPARDTDASFTYNPANQIVRRKGTNNAYAWTHHGSGSATSGANGLNQITDLGGDPVAHDPRGNLVAEGGRTFGYSSENLLVSLNAGGLAQTMRHDPLNRLHDEVTTGISSRQYLFDGDTLVGEYRSSLWFGPYVHGPGEDEPLFLLDNQGRRFWMHADERGSIVASSVPNGTVSGIHTYDEYGRRGLVGGRFGYAGKPWHGAARIYNNRARWYDPKLGRFLQVDPIGYDDQINLYAYVGNDPINASDPDGQEGILRWLGDSAKMVASDLADLGNLIVEGDFEGAFGGMPPTLGGPLSGLGRAGASVTARVAVVSRQAAVTRSAASELRRAASVIPRTTKAGERALKVRAPDGALRDISPTRVKEFKPVTHPNAPPGTMQRRQVANPHPGSKGLKRDPTPVERRMLEMKPVPNVVCRYTGFWC